MRKPRHSIHYLGSWNNPPSVCFAIADQRYTYILREPTVVDTIDYLAHKVSLGKALAFAKSRAIAAEKHR